VRLAADAHVLLVEPLPRMVRLRDVGGDPAVELVERPFAEQQHRRQLRRLASARKEVQVHEPATWHPERLAESPEPHELGLAHGKAVALGNLGEPPVAARQGQRRDGEERIAVGAPVHRVEQAILDRLVVPFRDGEVLDLVSEVPAERAHKWIRERPERRQHVMDDAGRENTRTVDTDRHALAARQVHAEVDGLDW
jgi:hypothetical protein